MSLKVKYAGGIGLLMYGFLSLMVNSKLWPNLAPLRDIRLWIMGDLDFDLKSHIIRAKSPPPPPRPTLTPGRFFLKIESLHPWVIGKAPTKYEVDWLSTFCAIEIDISGRLELVNSIFNFQETGTGIGIEISGRLELANYIFNSKFIPPITRIMFCYIIQISKIECPPLFSNTVGLSKSNFSVHK